MTSPPPELVDRRDRLLSTGPFDEALNAAISVRGLGIERLCARLRDQGAPVSTATLSYWRSGRSRPGRHASLAALSQLERILDVPAGALSALVGPARRRGRGHGSPGPAIAAWWPRPNQVAALTSTDSFDWDERLARISQHDRIVIGADHGEHVTVSRQVLRAETDGPDRWVAIVHTDEHDRAVPFIRPVRHCRLGRVVTRPAQGLVAAELLFDRRLRRGDTVITEHAIVNAAPYPLATNYERKFRLPVREYVLEICFDPAALPRSCQRFEQTDSGTELTRSVPLGETASVHAVALNFGPGRYGFRWDW